MGNAGANKEFNFPDGSIAIVQKDRSVTDTNGRPIQPGRYEYRVNDGDQYLQGQRGSRHRIASTFGLIREGPPPPAPHRLNARVSQRKLDNYLAALEQRADTIPTSAELITLHQVPTNSSSGLKNRIKGLLNRRRDEVEGLLDNYEMSNTGTIKGKHYAYRVSTFQRTTQGPKHVHLEIMSLDDGNTLLCSYTAEGGKARLSAVDNVRSVDLALVMEELEGLVDKWLAHQDARRKNG